MSTDDTFEQFHQLIKKGDVIAVREFIASGVSVDSRNRFGWTPLMLAANEGHTPIVTLLLSEGANVNAINDFGVSPLAYAALHGECRAIQVLLDAGASLDVRPQEFLSWSLLAGAVDGLRHRNILSCCEPQARGARERCQEPLFGTVYESPPGL